MKKLRLTLLTLMLAVTGIITCQAQDNSVAYNLTYSPDWSDDKLDADRWPTECTLAGYVGSEKPTGHVTIPAEIEADLTRGLETKRVKMRVIAIKNGALRYCKDITSISIPASVKRIGSYAFGQCEALERIEGMIMAEEIEFSAFASCKKLASLTLGEGMVTIGKEAFYGCTSLTQVNIPSTITTIGEEAFYNCTSLESVAFDPRGKLKVISQYAFQNCTALKYIELPGSVTQIGPRAFLGCSSLETFNTNNVDSIEVGAFNGCKSLRNITFGKALRKIKGSAFALCNSLTSVTIPDHVEYLGQNAFEKCANLNTVVLPDGMTELYTNTFADCKQLKYASIGKNTTVIESNAFSNCALEQLEVRCTTPPTFKNLSFWGESFSLYFGGTNPKTCYLKIPDDPEVKAAYRNARFWEEFFQNTQIVQFPCAAPRISIAYDTEKRDYYVMVASPTEGATCHTTIVCEDAGRCRNNMTAQANNNRIYISGVHTITSYATAPGYKASEIVTRVIQGKYPVITDTQIPNYYEDYGDEDYGDEDYGDEDYGDEDYGQDYLCTPPVIWVNPGATYGGEIVVTNEDGGYNYAVIRECSGETKDNTDEAIPLNMGAYSVLSYTHSSWEYDGPESPEVYITIKWMGGFDIIDGSDGIEAKTEGSAGESVAIRRNANGISILGTKSGETVTLTTLDGRLAGTIPTTDGETLIPAPRRGNAYIVKFRGKAKKLFF